MLPLILPVQGAAALDGLSFARTWYLFFAALRDYGEAGAGMVRYGTAAARAALSAMDVPDGSLYVETDSGLTYQSRLTANGGAWHYAAGVQVVDQTLTVASTTIKKPATGALLLIEIVRQDGTGGRGIVWDAAGFSAASSSLGTAALSTLCAFGFLLIGTKYVMLFEGPKDMTP